MLNGFYLYHNGLLFIKISTIVFSCIKFIVKNVTLFYVIIKILCSYCNHLVLYFNHPVPFCPPLGILKLMEEWDGAISVNHSVKCYHQLGPHKSNYPIKGLDTLG